MLPVTLDKKLEASLRNCQLKHCMTCHTAGSAASWLADRLRLIVCTNPSTWHQHMKQQSWHRYHAHKHAIQHIESKHNPVPVVWEYCIKWLAASCQMGIMHDDVYEVCIRWLAILP